MQKQIPKVELERAKEERQRLADIEQPKLDPARDCGRCFGTGFEQYKDQDDYNVTRICDHLPVPF